MKWQTSRHLVLARALAVAAVIAATSFQVLGTVSASAASSPSGVPILIGQIATEQSSTGATTYVGHDVLDAWAKWTNAHGGLNGHPVKVITQDDHGDPGTGLTAAQTLINQDKVVALVGNEGGTDLAWAPVVTSSHVPAIGAIAYTSAWITNPLFYTVGPQITGQIYGAMYAVAKIAKVKKAALLLCNEAAVCNSVVPLYQKYAKGLGIDLTTIVRASTTQPSYTADCLTLQQSGAQAVIVAAPPIQKVAADCAGQGYKPHFDSVDAFGVTPSIAKSTPGVNGLVSGVGGFPVFAKYPQTATFFKAIQRYYPAYLNNTAKHDLFVGGGTGGSIASLTWDAGVAFAKAVINAKVPASKPVSSADVIRGLSMFHDETLGGLMAPHTYGDGTAPNPGSPCFFALAIKGGKYTAPQGMKPYCPSLADEAP